MVSTGASKVDDLLALSQVVFEGFGGEGGATVTDEFHWDDSMVQTKLVKGLDGLQSLVCVQVFLELNKDETAGIVHHQTASGVASGIGVDSLAVDVGTSCGANKMIHRNTLSREELVLLQHWSSVGNFCSSLGFEFGGADGLFAKLTGCTFGWMPELGGSGLKSSLLLRDTQGSRLEQKLHLPKVNVSQPLMPSQ